MPELIAKYQLVSDDVIRAAIHILEERGAVSVDRRAGYVISARQDQN
jgi:DNA-binding GntR family transcriptional regulator